MPTSARECPSCRTPLPVEAQFCFRCGQATPTEPGVPPRTMPTGEHEVAKVRKVLAERYRIERVVGEGGMATVYLAQDLKHNRPVAVKVMRPELAATLGGDRFEREVEIAAQLNHPHILPMYDGGRSGGETDGRTEEVLYYVMPYVEGESLAARIVREGELPVQDALRIAREVAEALAYAHKRGIVHRDVKPANILLNEGHALVADFGIARAVGGEGVAITATGIAIGTPQYMSPEQATGGKEVDGRTDIYALGAVLYEMLTGEPPFTGRTPQAVVARMMTERPRSVTASREGLPPVVEDVVMRALARSPADRFATAPEMAAALAEAEMAVRAPFRSSPSHPAVQPPSRQAAESSPILWPALGGLAMIALVAVAFFAGRWGLPQWVLALAVALLAAGALMLGVTAQAERRRRGGAASSGIARLLTWRNAALGGVAALLAWASVASVASARRTTAADRAVEGTHVAVLPFQNQGDSADNYIVDGITDEVRGRLAGVNGLAIIGSGSSSQYRGTRLSQTEIARELGAEYLLLGRVRWAGTGDERRLQVVSELVDGATGATRWQQTFEAPLTDVFEVQSQIASRVAGALGTQIGTAETRTLTRRPTVNPEAWDAYLKGRSTSALDAVALRQSAAHFENAVTLDASFVEAWAALSRALGRLYANGGRDPTVAARSREAFERALALDSTSAAAHVAAAGYYGIVARDPDESVRWLGTALRLAPNDPDVLGAAGRAEIARGRPAVGLPLLERARELDPRSDVLHNDLQWTYLLMRRYPDALEAGEAALAHTPMDPGPYQTMAMVHAGQGDLSGARAVAARAIATGVSPPVMAAYYAGFFEMSWALPQGIADLVPRLSPSAFDDDRAWWGQAIATHYWTSGRRDLARAYADSALALSREQAERAPTDAGPRALYAVMLAYLGQRDEAIAEARRAVALERSGPGSRETHYTRLQLIRVYLALGEIDQALDEIEWITTTIGGYVTPRWLTVDPLFAPLKGNPRFDRLAAAS